MNKHAKVNQTLKAAETAGNKGRSFCSVPGTNQDRPDVPPHGCSVLFIFLTILALTTAARILLSLYDRLPLSLTEQSALLLSRNLFHGSLTFLTEPVHRGSILYSLLLAPFTFLSDSLLRLRLISAFNAVLLSSSLIPAYLLARRILKKPSHIILSLLVLALSPNLLFSLSFLPENLYYPLLLWGFYAAYRFFTSEAKKPLHAFLLGLFSFLLCFAHALGLAFAAAMLTAAAAGGTDNKKSRKEALLPPGLFLCGLLLPAALLKLTLFRSASLFPSVQAVFAHFTTASELVYWLYAAFLFLLFFLITTCFFPVALPFCRRKALSPANRSLLLLSGVYALCAALGAALVLSLRYDFADPYLTVYLRCLLGAAYPFLLLFLASPEEKEPLTKKSALLWLFVTFAALILLFLIVPRTRSPFDAPALQALSGLDYKSALWTWVCRGTPVLLAGAWLLVVNKKGKQALAWALLPVMLCCELAGGFFFVRDARRVNTADPDLLAEAVRLDECLDTLEGNILVAATSADDDFLAALAAVSDHDYAVTTFEGLRSLMTGPEGETRSRIDLSEPIVPCPSDRLIETYSLNGIDTVVTVGDNSGLDPFTYEEITPSGVLSARVFRASDPAALSLLDPRACVLGEPVLFYGPDAGFLRLSPEGFSLPENGYTWSQADEVSLTLVPHVTEPCDLKCTWSYLMTNGNQPCLVLANDVPVFDGDIYGPADAASFIIPAGTYAETGVLTLRFFFPDAREPGNGDPRLLAVAFESITLEAR